MATPDHSNTAPLYPPRTSSLEPGESEAYDIVAHLNALVLSGGSLLDEDDADDDPVPSLEELEVEYGIADDSDAWTGPTEAELPGIVASIKRFAQIGNPPPTLADIYGSDDE